MSPALTRPHLQTDPAPNPNPYPNPNPNPNWKALFNTFRVRFELGLFDPIQDQPLWKLGQSDIGTAEAKSLNLEMAQSSLVLIQNPGNIPKNLNESIQ